MKIVYFFIAVCTFGFVANKSIYDEQYIVDFLSHYGYLEKGLLGSNRNRNEIYIKDAISDFQHFSGIRVTGIMDGETMRMMQLPRCGVKDKVISRGVNQYILRGGQWELPVLNYAILNYTDNLSEKEIIDDITSAFNIWTKYTNLKFKRRKPSSKNLHIMIMFANYSHGDGSSFDGPGNIAGHAFPHNNERRGQIHLDVTENWTTNSSEGISLYQTVAHEIGHVLGIDHSMFSTSIMRPDYNYNETFRRELSSDDILAIQALYGVKRQKNNKPDKKPKKEKQEVICKTSPSQFYHFSQTKNDFLWDNKNKIQKELINFKTEKNKNKSSKFIYKLIEYVVCKKIKIFI